MQFELSTVAMIPRLPCLVVNERVIFTGANSFEKHTKQFIKHDLQDQHRHLCLQYRNVISMNEAETRYLAIRAWWSLSEATSEIGLKHLELWLAFWHFRYRQWGGFMELVSIDQSDFFLFVLIISHKDIH